LYASLGVIVVGNGLFKANAANLVRRIYEGGRCAYRQRVTIYYMAVNIGSTLSILATPWIKDHWGMARGIRRLLCRHAARRAELLPAAFARSRTSVPSRHRTGALEGARRDRAAAS